MAFQMSFESKDGTLHPASYWRPISVTLNISGKIATFVFAGYKDALARKAGKMFIGTKNYQLKPDQYDTYFSVAVLSTKDPLESCYDAAIAILDTNEASFFAGATPV